MLNFDYFISYSRNIAFIALFITLPIFESNMKDASSYQHSFDQWSVSSKTFELNMQLKTIGRLHSPPPHNNNNNYNNICLAFV